MYSGHRFPPRPPMGQVPGRGNFHEPARRPPPQPPRWPPHMRHPNNGLRSQYHQRLPPPPHPLNIPPNPQRFPARLPQRQPGPPDSYSYERAPFPHDIHHSAPEILQKPIVDTEGPFEGPQSLQHNNQSSGSHTENQACNQDERPAVSESADRDKTAIWIEKWLSDKKIQYRPKSNKNNTDQKISLPEFRTLFHRLGNLISNQQMFVSQLKQSINSCDNETWQYNVEQAQNIQMQIRVLREKLNPEVITNLVKKLDRIHRKRKRLQSRNCAAYHSSLEIEQKRDMLHAKIDQWREGILQQTAIKKMEADMKKSADRSLAEVRRKVNDAKQMIDTLKALAKLRELRKDAAKKKGMDVPIQSDLAFESKISELEENINGRLSVYNDEQRTLQAMLDVENEETKEKDREKRKEILRKTEKLRDAKLQTVLFGNPDTIDSSHPGYMCRKFFEAAEESVENLVKIRSEWDQYLCTSQSDSPPENSIPTQWVIPSNPTSGIWATAVDNT